VSGWWAWFDISCWRDGDVIKGEWQSAAVKRDETATGLYQDTLRIWMEGMRWESVDGRYVERASSSLPYGYDHLPGFSEWARYSWLSRW